MAGSVTRAFHGLGTIKKRVVDWVAGVSAGVTADILAFTLAGNIVNSATGQFVLYYVPA